MRTHRAVVRSVLASRRRTLARAIAGTVVHQACEASVPVAIGVVVDQAIAHGSVTALLWSLVGLAALFGMLTLSMRVGIRAMRAATLCASHEVRLSLAARVLHPNGIANGVARPGELLSTATSDANRVATATTAVWAVAGALSALAVAAAALLYASPVLALLVLVGLVPVFVLSQLAARPLQRRSGMEQAAAAHAAGLATDLLGGLRVLKGLGAEIAAAERYRRASGQSASAAVRAARALAARQGLIVALAGTFLAAVAYVGGRLVLAGTISVGEFISAIGLAQFLLDPFGRLAHAGAVFARVTASARRVADVVTAPFAVADPSSAVRPMPEPRGAITVRGLSCGPLRDLDVSIAAGEWVGIATTDVVAVDRLLACLGREAEPDAGSIEFDGVDIRTLRADDVRRGILVAAHDAVLFAGTVEDNVAAVAAGASVAASVAAAGVDQVVETLPEGMATRLGERGRTLSGGQQQRVALARALAADAPVLVLHEPTTAVDAVTEARIAAGVRRLRSHRTTLVVTTSPALLAVTDRVLVIDGGRVVADGRHEELARTDALYREVVLT